MASETCEFCGSAATPIETQDMLEGRTMRLCAKCRQFIAEGETPTARIMRTFDVGTGKYIGEQRRKR